MPTNLSRRMFLQGAAYVPFDPEYPPERLSFMVSDSRIRVLLTQDRIVAEGRSWSSAMFRPWVEREVVGRLV